MLITGKWSTRHLNIVIRITAVIVLVIAFSPATPLNSASANSNLFGIPARAAAAGASTPQLTQIVTGEEHTCALTPAGGVVCWGRNNYGQLGDGTFNPSDVPVPVQGLSSGVVSVSLASDRTCALTSLGRVYCWGNSTDNSPYTSVPVEVTGLGSQVVQLAVGNWHTCALTSSGKILCWGKNLDGELGNGTFTDSSTPVAAIAAGAAQVAVSVTGITGYTTCAVMTNGDVLCWGGGYSGQLGDGAYDGFHKSNLPVHVREADGSPLTGASQVGVGMQYACALVGSGVQCWGSDNDWELGTGEVGVRPFASPVLNSLGGPALSGADQLSTGDEVVCVHLSSGELKCWGWSDSGQIGNGWTGAALFPVTVVDTAGTAPFEGATRISAGGTHSCLFTNWEDAHPFYCWGDDSWGQLGIGSMGYFYKSVPQPVADISGLGGGSLEPQIVAGEAHTCSLTTGEGLKCWGANSNGQLGDGSTTDRQNPVYVAGLSGNVKSMALGDNFTCALLPWGRLKCWGENTHGQLSDGSKTDSPLPESVLPGVTVKQVATGSAHACVLTLAGSVLCWGDNTSGQLGDGSTTESTSPVAAIASGAVGIALGGSTSCALMSAGGIKCWGLGDMGQLGDGASGAGHKQVSATDVQVSGGGALAGATQVAVGANFGCALLAGGLVDCWGKNDVGQLGLGTTSTLSAHASPVLTEAGGDPLEAAMQVTAGGAHACVRMYTDRLKCWGRGELGQLGDGSSGVGTYSDIPHTVVDHYAPFDSTIPYLEVVSQVSAGGAHTCAFLKWDGTNPYRCWGDDSRGQLGDGGGTGSGQVGAQSTTFQLYPNPVKDSQNFGSPPLAKTAAGSEHTCALTQAGGVKCWGWNYRGQIGDGTWNLRVETPSSVVGLSSGVIGLAAGSEHTCALTSVGAVKCWGLDNKGQLGDKDTTNRNTPVDVVGLSSGVVELAAGIAHTCALTSSGGVKCWGWNYWGTLGDGSNTDSPTPVDVVGLSSGVIALTGGDFFTCALTSVGGVKCWGAGAVGRLGNNSEANSNIPVNVVGLGSGVVGLAAGTTHTCALTSGGGVKCWGWNYYGQLGDGANADQLTPVDVSGLASGVIEVAAGGNHTCVLTLTSMGAAVCWGDNTSGELGDGTNTNSNKPVVVTGLTDLLVTSLLAGTDYTCVVLVGPGPLRCWGSNAYGQLGTGDTTDEKGPVVSKWLTADGLVEDQKAVVIIPTIPNSQVVVPAQPAETPVVVTITQVTTPPPPCINCTLPGGIVIAFDDDEKPAIHWLGPRPGDSANLSSAPDIQSLSEFFRIDYTSLLAPTANNPHSAGGFDEQSLNLFHYDNGIWVPMLPCTGCSLDTTNHVLIATLDGPGTYEVMVQLPPSSLKYVYLPLVMR